MEEKIGSLESLFEKAVTYTNTSIALLKLKTIDKSSDVISTLAPRLFIMAIISIFILIISIGTALWLGAILGKSYDGFFLVGAFYLIVAITLFFMRKRIKKRVNDFIITQTLN